MKRLTLLVSMALASTAQAGNRADPLHDEHMRVSQQFCADAKTTLDYNACSGEELAQAQAELSATFAAALAKWQDSQETADALRHAQKAWEVTFEADVAARFAEADAARVPCSSANSCVAPPTANAIPRLATNSSSKC